MILMKAPTSPFQMPQRWPPAVSTRARSRCSELYSTHGCHFAYICSCMGDMVPRQSDSATVLLHLPANRAARVHSLQGLNEVTTVFDKCPYNNALKNIVSHRFLHCIWPLWNSVANHSQLILTFPILHAIILIPSLHMLAMDMLLLVSKH